jgi:hypothetical protein
MKNDSGQKEKRIRWKALLDEQIKSGLSQEKFCKEKNISSAQLGYYRRSFGLTAALASKKSPSAFETVKMADQDQETSIRIHLPNGFRCECSSLMDMLKVKKLIEVLLSC